MDIITQLYQPGECTANQKRNPFRAFVLAFPAHNSPEQQPLPPTHNPSRRNKNRRRNNLATNLRPSHLVHLPRPETPLTKREISRQTVDYPGGTTRRREGPTSTAHPTLAINQP